MNRDDVHKLWATLVAYQPCSAHTIYEYEGHNFMTSCMSFNDIQYYLEKWHKMGILRLYSDGTYYIASKSAAAVHLLDRVEMLESYMGRLLGSMMYMTREYTEQQLHRHMDKNLVAITMTFVQDVSNTSDE
jgi:hypothetical protein